MSSSETTNYAKGSSPQPQLKVVQPKLIAVPQNNLTDSRANNTSVNIAPPIQSPGYKEEKRKSTEDTPTINPQSRNHNKNWLIVGAIAFGIVGVGFIPIEHKLPNKDGVIDSTSSNSKIIPLPQGFVIEQLGVKHGKEVKKDDTVVKLSDEQLSEQILKNEQELANLYSELKSAQQTYSFYLHQQQQVQSIANSAARRAKERQQDINRINQGRLPEQLLELHETQATREIEREGLKEQLNLLNLEIDRDEELVKQGALAKAKLNEPHRKKLSLENQLKAKRFEIDQTKAKIQVGKRQLADDFSARSDEAQEKEIAVVAKGEEIKVALAGVDKANNQIIQLEKQQFQLQQRQNKLTIKAPLSGLVIAPDIEKWRGQKLTEPKKIEIINRDNLIAKVMVEDYDAASIKPGMIVTYIPTGQQQEYKAKVQNIDWPLAENTPATQKRMIPVQIVFEKSDTRFVYKTMGKATIHIEKIRVYEFINNEVYKVFHPLINQLR